MELSKVRADAAELVGGRAGFGLEQFQAVHDGADCAPARIPKDQVALINGGTRH